MATATHLQRAGIVGRAHLARHEGGQDAAALASAVRPEGSAFWVGAVADGCGSAPLSQVGAALLVAVAVREATSLLRAGVPTASLVAPVLAAARRGLFAVAAAIADEDDRRGFVETHLLATLLVLAHDGETTTIFGRGDGLVGLDDAVILLDRGGAPDYLAYDLFGEPATPFSVTKRGVERAFIATDGLSPEHAPAMYGHRGRELQRWLNVLADRAPLADDATLVVLEHARAQAAVEGAS